MRQGAKPPVPPKPIKNKDYLMHPIYEYTDGDVLDFTEYHRSLMTNGLMLAAQNYHANSENSNKEKGAYNVSFLALRAKVESPDTHFFNDFSDEEFDALIEAIILTDQATEQREIKENNPDKQEHYKNCKSQTTELVKRMEVVRDFQKSYV